MPTELAARGTSMMSYNGTTVSISSAPRSDTHPGMVRFALPEFHEYGVQLVVQEQQKPYCTTKKDERNPVASVVTSLARSGRSGQRPALVAVEDVDVVVFHVRLDNPNSVT